MQVQRAPIVLSRADFSVACSKMWGSIGRDVFSVIGAFLDGQDAARCAAVCKKWNYYVGQCDRLAIFRRHHYIKVDDIDQLESTLRIQAHANVVQHKDNFRVDSMFATLLWYDYGLNWFRLENEIGHLRYPHELFYHMIIQHLHVHDGEGGNGWVDENGNITHVSNFYTAQYFNSPNALRRHYDIVALETFAMIFDGQFTWRLVEFPIQGDNLTRFNGAYFHRGACVQFILKSKGNATQPIPSTIRYLKKCTLPNEHVQVGTGKKRKWINVANPKNLPDEKFIRLLKLFKQRRQYMHDNF